MAQIQDLQNRLRDLELEGNRMKLEGLPLPAFFDGSEDFGTYLEGFNIIATSRGWEPQKCCQILPTFLRGMARAVYQGLDDDQKADWRNLIDNLNQRLQRMYTKEDARRILVNRKMRHGESLEEYVQVLCKLVNRAYPDAALRLNLPAGDPNNELQKQRIAQFKMELARDHFLQGLKPEIKDKLDWMEDPRSLEEAVTMAKRIEERLKAREMAENRRDESAKNEILLSKVNEIETEVAEIRSGFNQNRGNSSRPNPMRGYWREGQSNWQRGMPNWQGGQWPNRNQGFRGRGSARGRGGLNRNFTPRQNFGRNFEQPNRPWIQNNRNSQNPNLIPITKPRWQPPAKQIPRVNEVGFPYFCLVAILGLIFLPAIDGQYQICPTKTNDHGIAIEFPKPNACALPANEQPKSAKVFLYIPIRMPKRFPAYRCWKNKIALCTENIFFISEDQPPIATRFEIKAEDCWKIWDSANMTRITEKVWATPEDKRREYRWVGTKCRGTERVYMEEGEAGILEGRRLVTSWGDNLIIDLEKHKEGGWMEDDAQKILLWRIPGEEAWNTHFKLGPVKAEIWSEKGVVLDDLEYSFVKSQNQERDNWTFGVPENAEKFENDVYIKFVNETRKKREYTREDISWRQVTELTTRFPLMQNWMLTGRTLRANYRLTTTTVKPTTIPPWKKESVSLMSNQAITTIGMTSQKPTTKMVTSTTRLRSPSTTPTTTTTTVATTKRKTQTTKRVVSTTRFSPTSATTKRVRASTAMSTTRKMTERTTIPSTRRTVWTTVPTPKSTQKVTTRMTQTRKHTIQMTTPKTKMTVPTTKKVEILSIVLPTQKNHEIESKTTVNPIKEDFESTSPVEEQNFENQAKIWMSEWPKKAESNKVTLEGNYDPFRLLMRIARSNREDQLMWKTKLGEESHMNSRLNYFSLKTDEQRRNEARNQWMADCNDRNNQLAVALALAKIVPEEAARTLYNRDDVTAILLKNKPNELLWWIAVCKQVQPDLIYWEQKVEERCYNELPVKIEGKTMFVKIGTRDLVKEGTPIDCKNVKSSQNHEVKNSDGQLGKHRFTPEKFINRQNPLMMKKGSIFETEQMRLEQNLQDLAKRLNRPSLDLAENSYELMMNKSNQTDESDGLVTQAINIGKAAFSEAAEHAKIAYSEAGQAAQSVRNFTKEGLESLEEGKGLLKYAKWAIIIIVVLIITILACILFWKIKTYVFIFIQIAQIAMMGVRFIIGIFGKREMRREIAVNQIELEELAMKLNREPPSAPMEELLDRKAYILTYIPEICAISRQKKRCHVMVKIDGQEIRALFDTGSDLTFVGREIAEKHGWRIRKGDCPQAMAANNTPMKFSGSVFPEIELGLFRGKFPILVSNDESCSNKCILGGDLMERINEELDSDEIGLNFKERKIRIGDMTLPMICELEFKPKPCEVRLINTEVLPAMSDSLIWGYIDRSFDTDDKLITIERDHKYFPLRVGKCLVSPGSRRIVPLRVFNYGNSELKVFANSRLAMLDPLDGKENEMIFGISTDQNEENWEKLRNEVIKDIPDAGDLLEGSWELTKAKSKPDERQLFERISLEGTILSQNGIEKWRRLVEKYREAFSIHGEIGEFRGKVVHKIELVPGARPVQQRAYRYPLALQPEIEKHVKKLMDQGIIRPSTSAWASPIVLARKSDGSYRFCVDYRKLNSLTKRQTYVLPRIQDLIDQVSGKKVFTVIDMSSAFHQLKMAKGHEERSAFICHLGLYEWIRAPFGLAGLPHQWQKAMESIRAESTARFAIYLDDSLIASMNEEEHLMELEKFLAAMVKYGLKLNPEKCRIALPEIRYLGHLISEHGIRIDPKDLEPIRKLRKPATLKELRSLIGMIAYFRKFIYNFAALTKPLYELTKKENTSDWGEEHDRILELIKEKLTTAPVLAPPRLGHPFTLETDASILAIAAVLLQEWKGETHPVAYFSRVLNKFESKYAIVELEALAIAASVRNFKPYIEGSHTIVITDNSALTTLMRRKDLEGRLARYQLAIMAADIEIKYRPGPQNKVADVLSRNFTNDQQNLSEVSAIEIGGKIGAEEMRREQEKDENLKANWEILKMEKERGNTQPKVGIYVLWKGMIGIENEGVVKIVVPKSLQTRVMNEYHSDALHGAHLGVKRTQEKIKRLFHWERMNKDILDFVKHCEACQKRKIVGKMASREPILPIEPAGSPFERIHADVLGPVQTAPGGFRFVIVFVDSFSKFLITVPLREQSATTITNAFVDKVICRFGTPKVIVTDCGTNFLSETFEGVAKLFKIEHRTSTPYHQAANGQCERYMRTIADMISTMTGGKNWNSLLPKITFAYNTSMNGQIGYSPFHVIHGWDAMLPIEASLGKESPQYDDMAIYVRELTEHLAEIREKVSEKLKRNVEVMKDQQIKVNKLEWEPGMLVLIRKTEQTRKFEEKFSGPYQIIQVEQSNLLLKALDEDSEPFRIHKDRCKPFYGNLDEEVIENSQKSEEDVQKRKVKIMDPNIEESDSESDEKDVPQVNEMWLEGGTKLEGIMIILFAEASGRTTRVILGRSQEFGPVMEDFEGRRGSAFTFWHKGERVFGTHTPQSLNMVDNDVIRLVEVPWPEIFDWISGVEVTENPEEGSEGENGECQKGHTANCTLTKFEETAFAEIEIGHFKIKFSIFDYSGKNCSNRCPFDSDLMKKISEEWGNEEIGFNLKEKKLRIGGFTFPMTLEIVDENEEDEPEEKTEENIPKVKMNHDERKGNDQGPGKEENKKAKIVDENDEKIILRFLESDDNITRMIMGKTQPFGEIMRYFEQERWGSFEFYCLNGREISEDDNPEMLSMIDNDLVLVNQRTWPETLFWEEAIERMILDEVENDDDLSENDDDQTLERNLIGHDSSNESEIDLEIIMNDLSLEERDESVKDDHLNMSKSKKCIPGKQNLNSEYGNPINVGKNGRKWRKKKRKQKKGKSDQERVIRGMNNKTIHDWEVEPQRRCFTIDWKGKRMGAYWMYENEMFDILWPEILSEGLQIKNGLDYWGRGIRTAKCWLWCTTPYGNACYSRPLQALIAPTTIPFFGFNSMFEISDLSLRFRFNLDPALQLWSKNDKSYTIIAISFTHPHRLKTKIKNFQNHDNINANFFSKNKRTKRIIPPIFPSMSTNKDKNFGKTSDGNFVELGRHDVPPQLDEQERQEANQRMMEEIIKSMYAKLEKEKKEKRRVKKLEEELKKYDPKLNTKISAEERMAARIEMQERKKEVRPENKVEKFARAAMADHEAARKRRHSKSPIRGSTLDKLKAELREAANRRRKDEEYLRRTKEAGQKERIRDEGEGRSDGKEPVPWCPPRTARREEMSPIRDCTWREEMGWKDGAQRRPMTGIGKGNPGLRPGLQEGRSDGQKPISPPIPGGWFSRTNVEALKDSLKEVLGKGDEKGGEKREESKEKGHPLPWHKGMRRELSPVGAKIVIDRMARIRKQAVEEERQKYGVEREEKRKMNEEKDKGAKLSEGEEKEFQKLKLKYDEGPVLSSREFHRLNELERKRRENEKKEEEAEIVLDEEEDEPFTWGCTAEEEEGLKKLKIEEEKKKEEEKKRLDEECIKNFNASLKFAAEWVKNDEEEKRRKRKEEGKRKAEDAMGPKDGGKMPRNEREGEEKAKEGKEGWMPEAANHPSPEGMTFGERLIVEMKKMSGEKAEISLDEMIEVARKLRGGEERERMAAQEEEMREREGEEERTKAQEPMAEVMEAPLDPNAPSSSSAGTQTLVSSSFFKAMKNAMGWLKIALKEATMVPTPAPQQ